MIPFARIPMFGFSVLAFLLLCAVLAVAVWFALRGTAEGRSRVSGPAGCAIGCALLAIAGLGALVTGAVIAFNLPAEWARHGPVERLELRWDEERGSSGSESAARQRAQDSGRAGTRVFAEIELRPGHEAGPIVRALRESVTEGLQLTIRSVERQGVARTLIEIEAPLDEETEHELREALRELRAEVPGFDLPEGIVLEIRGPND